MPNGIWNKETYMMGVPKEDEKRAAMTFDMLKSIDTRLDLISELPEKCAAKMDNKIENNNKIHRRINLGIGGLGAGGVVGIIEGIKSFFANG